MWVGSFPKAGLQKTLHYYKLSSSMLYFLLFTLANRLNCFLLFTEFKSENGSLLHFCTE